MKNSCNLCFFALVPERNKVEIVSRVASRSSVYPFSGIQGFAGGKRVRFSESGNFMAGGFESCKKVWGGERNFNSDFKIFICVRFSSLLLLALSLLLSFVESSMGHDVLV